MPTPIEEMTAAIQNPSADPAPPVAGDISAAPSPPEGAEPAAAAPDAAKPDIIGADPAAPAGDTPAPELDGQGRMRDPVTKKFVAAEPKAGDPPPAAKAAEPPAAVVPPKTLDPVNDPIPPTLKKETSERMVALIETVKAKDVEVSAAREDFELVMAPIREAGANPDQFRESMNLVKLINSPLAADQHTALQYLQSAAAAMAEKLGVVPAGVDPLHGFDDLQLEVQKNPSLRKWAEEAASGRRLREATQRQSQEQQQRSQNTQEQQRAAQAGQAAVAEVEQTLKGADTQYAAKIAIIRADTAFMGQLKASPPSQWASKFAQKYRTITIAPPAAKAPGAPSAPSPLRAKQPAGQAARVPSSSLEAVSAAIRG